MRYIEFFYDQREFISLAGTHVKVFIVLVLTMALAGCLTGNVSMKSAKYGGLNSKSIRKIPGHHLIVTNPEGFKIRGWPR